MRAPRRTGSKIYYGWPMLLGLSAAQVTSWGIVYYTFAVFLAPVNADLGWSIAQMTGAFSLALLLSGVAAIPVGRWIDRHGPRALMTAGSIAATLLIVAWSRVDSLPGLYLIWAAIGIVMATILYEPAFIIVANWFERLRSRALTVLTVIAGLASVVYIPLASWLIQAYGWRTALLILAVILAIGTVPIHALMLRRSPGDMGLQPDGDRRSVHSPPTGRPTHAPGSTLGAALRERAFWWISTAFILATFADMALTIHLIPFLIERGYTAGFAASAAALIGLVKLPGRVVFVPLAERMDLRVVIAIIFAVQAIAVVALVQIPGTLGVVLFVGLFGAVVGAVTPARAALIGDIWGRKHYGSISGALATTTTVSRSIAPVGAGLLYTVGNSYTPVMWLLIAISLLASFAVLRARPGKVLAVTESPV
jgi:MFS family permease